MSNRKSSNRPAGDVIDDHLKTRDDWNKLKLEVLKLKCNQYALISNGKKTTLAKRLFDHCNKQTEVNINVNPREHEVNETTNTNDESSNLVLCEIRALRSEVAAMKEKQKDLQLQQDSRRTGQLSGITETENNQFVESEVVRGFRIPPFINAGMSDSDCNRQRERSNNNADLLIEAKKTTTADNSTCNDIHINSNNN